MQISVKTITKPHCATLRFAVVVDGIQGEDFGTKAAAFRLMDVLWDARSGADQRIEQNYTGR